jgi:hypothetical protein
MGEARTTQVDRLDKQREIIMDSIPLLGLLVAVIVGIATVIGLRYMRLANEENRRSREAQEKLADLELASLTQKTTVEVVLASGRLQVKNSGNVEARNVRVMFQPLDGKSHPEGLHNIEPIMVLAPHADFTKGFVRPFASSSNLQGEWRWVNPDGTESHRQNEFRL